MVVFSKSPFTEDEIRYFSNSFSQHGYKPILIPGQVMRAPYSSLLNGETGPEEFHNLFRTKAYFVTDNSPYFLSYEKPVPETIQNLLNGSVAIAVAFLLIPFVWLRRSDGKGGRLGIASTIPYFAALGIGFILIELALFQKLILLLGNPTMTFAILLFTLLLSSGGGSLTSSKVIRNDTRNLAFVISGIAALGTLYVMLLPSIIYSVVGETFEAKAAFSIAVLAPIGFLMGMPLPTGMRLLKVHRPEYIPWMWAVNGAFSVLGAVLAVIIGIMYGSSEAMILGILIYFIALAISFFAWKKKAIVSVAT
jgi:hypothetical protein